MNNPETAVREAALVLWTAIDAARKSGLVITWPSRPEGLASLAISAGGYARYTETGPFLAGGGEALDLTEAERVALPPLDPEASNDPATFGIGEPNTPKGRKAKA